MRLTPLLEEPVVPRTDAREPEVPVPRIEEHPTAESRDLGREVHRRPYTRHVHVSEACVDVEAARAHLVEAERLHLDGVAPSANHRVESHLRVVPALELPRLVSFGIFDDTRRVLPEPSW